METRIWRFGLFRLDVGAERLWRGTEAVRLTAKAFGVLRCMVAHAGQLVTKEDLFATVWGAPGRCVAPAGAELAGAPAGAGAS